jgi:hypothetical protein
MPYVLRQVVVMNSPRRSTYCGELAADTVTSATRDQPAAT